MYRTCCGRKFYRQQDQTDHPLDADHEWWETLRVSAGKQSPQSDDHVTGFTPSTGKHAKDVRTLLHVTWCLQGLQRKQGLFCGVSEDGTDCNGFKNGFGSHWRSGQRWPSDNYTRCGQLKLYFLTSCYLTRLLHCYSR